jgi:Acetylornithine deacetylase/Succinyl-diaminopimelate desuccinylase and related deacylases
LATDWTAVRAETVALLQRLIRFDTTNPPGNELPLARYITEVLMAEGIETQLLTPAENRAAIVARIHGNGKGRPVMMLAHMDVVGVEADKWSTDPFGGVVRDGYLYGRGAIDDKGMLAANIMAMLLIQRTVVAAGTTLDRDVVFVATSDEEAGGAAGIKWLVDNHRSLFDAEFAINEGGRTRIVAGGKRYLAIQTAEKISHMVTLTARGPAGHAAIPLEGNAIFRLARAMDRIRHYREPVTLTETTRRFFADLATIWPDAEQRGAMAELVSEGAAAQARGATVLSRIPMFNAVMRNGISPTSLLSGVRGNVIPAEASAILNVRTIPGHSIEDVVLRLRQAVDDDGIEIAISAHGAEAPASDPASQMFRSLASSARELDAEIAVVPYLSTGGTDSAQLRRIGINSYGILPFPMAQEDEERMHGHDERVPVESLHFGTRLIFESVRRIAMGSARGV